MKKHDEDLDQKGCSSHKIHIQGKTVAQNPYPAVATDADAKTQNRPADQTEQGHDDGHPDAFQKKGKGRHKIIKIIEPHGGSHCGAENEFFLPPG